MLMLQRYDTNVYDSYVLPLLLPAHAHSSQTEHLLAVYQAAVAVTTQSAS